MKEKVKLSLSMTHDWERKHKSIQHTQKNSSCFFVQERPSHWVTEGTYNCWTWESVLTQAGCRRTWAKRAATEWPTPSLEQNPFRIDYFNELLLKPGCSKSYAFRQTTMSLFCKNNHLHHHHGSDILSVCHVPGTLWDRCYDSQRTAAERKIPPTPPPTHTQKKKKKTKKERI